MKQIISIALICFLSIASTFGQKKEKIVEVSTGYGTIKLKLYNETPQHRDNFIKLASEGFYDSLLFHRIIDGFMIQGGDPNSKNAQPGAGLGNGGPGYTIPAEIVPEYYHKKGALCAARKGDQINPLKASSGSQFYIVHGKTYNAENLKSLADRTNRQTKTQLYRKCLMDPANKECLEGIKVAEQTQNWEARDSLIKTLDPIIEEEYSAKELVYTEEMLKTYAEQGGAPHLDGNYTVFGEVIEGLDVIDKIAKLEKDQKDRPISDVRMMVKVLK